MGCKLRRLSDFAEVDKFRDMGAFIAFMISIIVIMYLFSKPLRQIKVKNYIVHAFKMSLRAFGISNF